MTSEETRERSLSENGTISRLLREEPRVSTQLPTSVGFTIHSNFRYLGVQVFRQATRHRQALPELLVSFPREFPSPAAIAYLVRTASVKWRLLRASPPEEFLSPEHVNSHG